MKWIYTTVGIIAFGLGAVGAVVPVLPTTPFLLLAALCLAKSFAKMEVWLKGTTIYKNRIESVLSGRGMSKKAKIKTILTVTVVLGISFFIMRDVEIVRIILAVVWLAHTIGIGFFVRTSKAEEKENGADEKSDNKIAEADIAIQ